MSEENRDRLRIHRLTVGVLQVNCYVVWDKETKEAVVIDAGGDGDKILQLLKAYDLRVQRLVNTHCHFDHVGGVSYVKEETGAPFYIHRAGREILAEAQVRAARFGLHVDEPPLPDGFVEDGDTFRVGEILCTVRHTPGHSPGGICLFAPDAVFTGDTLFAGSIGRYDIPGSSLDDLIHSIRTVLLPLPDSAAIYPGHGPASNMAIERAHNPFLRMIMTEGSLPGILF